MMRLGSNTANGNLEISTKKCKALSRIDESEFIDACEKCIKLFQAKRHECSNLDTHDVPTIYYIGLGKTGSTSIMLGFEKQAVAHWHSKTYFENTYGTTLLSDNNISLFELVAYIGVKYAFKPLIVECVREPISRQISWVFQRIYDGSFAVPKEEDKFGQTEWFSHRIKAALAAENPNMHMGAREWPCYFDITLEFDHEKKHFYCETDCAKLLLLRFEDIEQRKAIFAQLGYNYTPNHAKNSSKRGLVAGTAAAEENVLKRRVADANFFSHAELTRIYSDKDTTDFYSKPEIENFIQKHTQQRSADFSAKEANVKKRPFAFYTIVREENYYLPKWYAYYSQFVGDKDIHIIHHKPQNNERAEKDTCCDFLKQKDCSVYVEDQEFFSTRWIRDVAKQYQQKLLTEYEAVVFTDVDEIITVHPDSGFAHLGEFMRHFVDNPKEPSNWRVTGYSLIHLPDAGEPAFDYDKPIFEQRMYWYRDRYYDKPLVSKIALDWVFGFHTAPNMNLKPHPHLYMIHLHQFDFDWYMQRHVRWAKEYKVADEDKRSTYNSHYREENSEKLTFQYYHYFRKQTRIDPTLLPRWVRERLAVI